MVVLYFIAVKLYAGAIFIASFFNAKASQWVRGRSNWQNRFSNSLGADERRIHVHCASAGEFEQGRPLLELLRKNYSSHKIVLTFFSPSGYELRKNEPLADYVFYLPSDGPVNAKNFVSLVNPEMVFFVKYEFWHFYIKEYRSRKIPVYFVSSVFRPTQIFFQKGMSFFHNILVRVSHFFVQNQESLELLYKHGITQVSVTGDTRFDRVIQNSLTARELPEIEKFKGSKKLLVAGSTWKQDEKILLSLINSISNQYRVIIAPHEIKPSVINRLTGMFKGRAITYSEWDKANSDSPVLIIDNIGMLSSLYRYADAAYVGGGFGNGIHNILEAAVFGIPVFFGPRYKKFREAKELVHWKGAFTIKNENDLQEKFTGIMDDGARLAKIKEINLKYIENNKGSTELIINYLKVNASL